MIEELFEDYLDPDDLDDALVEQLADLGDDDLDDLYETPRDPLAGEPRPVNSVRRHRSRGRAVEDLPAL